MDMATQYAIMVEPLPKDYGAGWLASIPALPGCMGDGETEAEALADALSAIEEWKGAARQLEHEISSPAAVDWCQRS
jgi:antitoxin HicB